MSAYYILFALQSITSPGHWRVVYSTLQSGRYDRIKPSSRHLFSCLQQTTKLLGATRQPAVRTHTIMWKRHFCRNIAQEWNYWLDLALMIKSRESRLLWSLLMATLSSRDSDGYEIPIEAGFGQTSSIFIYILSFFCDTAAATLQIWINQITCCPCVDGSVGCISQKKT